MDSKVDMTYSLMWDTEPSDEQLNEIMKEVGEDVRREHEEIRKMITENIHRTWMQLRRERQIP
ncbi:MAG: hypothetical protein LBT42_06300 [Tannerella sp.]|jgi:ElaB/YqjD/DUF883 family membrane-anchored ribosome-binding protein|nr:hypothetical protein [Tannerella sp.]